MNANRYMSVSFKSGRGNASSSGTYLEKKEAAKRAKMEKKCTNCNQKGHSVDRCFKIHGYPEWFKETKSNDNAKKAADMSEYQISPLEFENTGNTGTNVDNALINVVC